MMARTVTGAIEGIDGYVVHAEVDISDGLPCFRMVGLPDTSAREARERVRAAVRNSGFKYPGTRIAINLAPADVRKHGSAFDLAVAVALLRASEQIELRWDPSRTVLLGELGLDGNLRHVRGVLPVAMEAKRRGKEAILVPELNREEAALVAGLAVYPVGSLREAAGLLAGEVRPSPWAPVKGRTPAPDLPDLAEVKGQYMAKRALEVAASGGHNVLFYGPPGAGKTLLARRLPSILPELSFEEALDVTRVHSVAGRLSGGHCLITHPPFRSPHHTASWAALAGGGSGPMPGEVSLAHRGVLFLDEFSEFARSSLEALRQPLEEGSITVSRVGRSICYPARFILVAAMNPCPCGYFGADSRPCSCTPPMVDRYRSKISGPLLDRIDIQVFVRSLKAEELLAPSAGEPSRFVRQRVARSRRVQRRRFGRSRTGVNARMRPRQLSRHCRLDRAGRDTLRRAVGELGLSARAFDRILKVARTIADLAECEEIDEVHLREAIQYRMLDCAAAT